MRYLLRRDHHSAPWELVTAERWQEAGLTEGPDARVVTEVLAIVGHERLLHSGDLLRAQAIVEDRLGYESGWPYQGAVVTGGARGVDRLAMDVAEAMDLPLIVYRPTVSLTYPPTVSLWAAPGGYRDRNEKVAQLATRCLCIRCSLNPRYGAGWTADRVGHLGKPVERVII